MSFPGTIWGHYGDEQAADGTTKRQKLGTRMVLPDGRVYRYASAGEALTASHVVMQSITDDHMDMDRPTVATAAGATRLTLSDASGITAHYYDDGYAYINDSTAGGGQGHLYRIGSHDDSTTGAAQTKYVQLARGSVTKGTMAVSSLIGFIRNPYSSVEIYDIDDIDGPPLGVAPIDVDSGGYFWAQTWGFACILQGADTVTLGKTIVAATAGTDGAVATSWFDATTGAITTARLAAAQAPVIGIASGIAAASGDSGFFYLTIAP